MIEYLILAVSFAIMVHIRYVHEVLHIVQDLRVALDIEEEENPFTPVLFSIVFFVFSAVLAPFMSMYIFGKKREVVLKDISSAVIKSYFQLEEK